MSDEVLTEKVDKTDLNMVEKDILRMLVGEMFDSEIAFALDISEEELKEKCRDLYRRFGVPNRAAAVSAAIKHGIVRTDL